MDKLEGIKQFIFENKKKILIGVSIFIIMALSLGGIFIYKNAYKSKSEKIVYENVAIEHQEGNTKEENTEEYYYIDIKGEVNNPGVYSILKGKRVVDVINLAGGLKENANTSLLNLSMLVKDQMVIIIYSNKEILTLEDTVRKENIKTTICKDPVKNDACTTNSETTTKIPALKSNNSSDNSTTNTDNLASEKININTSSKELLMTLSKIGESKAISIIEYREKNGGFKNIEEIKNVNGIGDSLFESIKDYITV